MSELPSMQAILQRRAQRLGIRVEDLLEHDREAIREMIALDDESCLSVDEVQSARLLPLLLHVLDCPVCAAFVRVYSQKKA